MLRDAHYVNITLKSPPKDENPTQGLYQRKPFGIQTLCGMQEMINAMNFCLGKPLEESHSLFVRFQPPDSKNSLQLYVLFRPSDPRWTREMLQVYRDHSIFLKVEEESSSKILK